MTGALADIDRGGDVAPVRAKVDGRQYTLAAALAPDTVVSGVMSSAGKPPRAVEIEATARGKRVVLARAGPCASLPEWLRAWSASAPRPEKSRMLVSPSVLALVEPIVRHGPGARAAGARDRWTGW